MKLSGGDCQKLVSAMLQAYPNKSDLEQMIRFNLDQVLDEIVGGQTTKDIIYNLICWFESRGKLEDLLNAVSQDRPDNIKIQETVKELLNKIKNNQSHSNEYNFDNSYQYKHYSNVDYTRLEQLLKANKWLEADQETIKVVYQATNKQEFCVAAIWDIAKIPFDALSAVDLENLANNDLMIIDYLWKKYSQEKFGFSTQVCIYKEQREDYYSFCNRLGWRKGEQWVGYNDLLWTLEAPYGHLPWIQGRKMYLTEKAMRNTCFSSMSLAFGDNAVSHEDTIISVLFQKLKNL